MRNYEANHSTNSNTTLKKINQLNKSQKIRNEIVYRTKKQAANLTTHNMSMLEYSRKIDPKLSAQVSIEKIKTGSNSN